MQNYCEGIVIMKSCKNVIEILSGTNIKIIKKIVGWRQEAKIQSNCTFKCLITRVASGHLSIRIMIIKTIRISAMINQRMDSLP